MRSDYLQQVSRNAVTAQVLLATSSFGLPPHLLFAGSFVADATVPLFMVHHFHHDVKGSVGKTR